MSKHDCKNCIHFKQAPWEANKTGCWHKDNLEMSLSANFNDEQQIPGNHRKINLRGDCAQFEARAAAPSFFERFLNMGGT